MSKHKMVDGRLLQMNKSFGQLKQKQREKIAEWMYQTYKKQASEKLAAMGYTNIYEFGGINTWTGEIVTEETEE